MEGDVSDDPEYLSERVDVPPGAGKLRVFVTAPADVALRRSVECVVLHGFGGDWYRDEYPPEIVFGERWFITRDVRCADSALVQLTGDGATLCRIQTRLD